jgi:anti-sigma-K factor RskA
MNIREYISSGIIEQYVMGLCNDAENKEVETLRLQYPEFDKAIIDYEIQLEENMQINFTLPSAEIDEIILKKINELRPPQTSNSSSAIVRKINWLKPFAAAAILLLFTSGYFIYTLNKKTTELRSELAAAKNAPATLPPADYKIMLDPRITPVAMYGVGTHAICRCTMFWDKNTGKIFIMIHHLPMSSTAKDYQLWAMVDGKPVSIGIINDAIRGRFIEMEKVPAGATAFTVTLEKAGGNTTPTMAEEYLRGNI